MCVPVLSTYHMCRPVYIPHVCSCYVYIPLVCCCPVYIPHVNYLVTHLFLAVNSKCSYLVSWRYYCLSLFIKWNICQKCVGFLVVESCLWEYGGGGGNGVMSLNTARPFCCVCDWHNAMCKWLAWCNMYVTWWRLWTWCLSRWRTTWHSSLASSLWSWTPTPPPSTSPRSNPPTRSCAACWTSGWSLSDMGWRRTSRSSTCRLVLRLLLPLLCSTVLESHQSGHAAVSCSVFIQMPKFQSPLMRTQGYDRFSLLSLE